MVFISDWSADSDFGTKIRIKCHQQIQRTTKTSEGELCTNWELIDSFGVRLDDSIHHTDGYKQFYEDPRDHHIDPHGYSEFVIWDSSGKDFDKMSILIKIFRTDLARSWLKKYATINHQTSYGGKGFILKNEIFQRFEPTGITWNDFYCRKITDAEPSGCFVERDLSTFPHFGYRKNNCAGKI